MTTKHVMEEMSMKPDNTDTVKLHETIRVLEGLMRTGTVGPDTKIYGPNLEHLPLAEFIKQMKPGNTELPPIFRGLFRWVGQNDSIDNYDAVENTEYIAVWKSKRINKIA